MIAERLSKRMAAAGIASRRACEEIIFEGRVKVNGEVVTTPQTLVERRDMVFVDGEAISLESKVYYVLNKPRGMLCTSEGSKSVLNLFSNKRRLFTVGRLDKDTEGLLLVTNDGEFANRVIHPSANIHKEYLVKVSDDIMHDHLVTISNGMNIDGTFVKPIRVKKMRRGTMKVTVGEGKKREIRRLVDGAGLEVLELTRIRIGSLQLGNLPVGAWRPLTNHEIEQLTGSN